MMNTDHSLKPVYGYGSAGDCNARCDCLDLESPEPLIAAAPVYLDVSLKKRLFDAVRSVGSVLEASAPDAERMRAEGIFNSFDFHLSKDGPKLIEVNTNAGGLFLQSGSRATFNLVSSDCDCSLKPDPPVSPEAMILAAWATLSGPERLRNVAIVDATPEKQPLFDDMCRAAIKLRVRGINARVTDLTQLSLIGGRLCDQHGPIQLVYNRSTDFLLRSNACRALRDAWRRGAALVLPNPRVYHTYADKQRLIDLIAQRRQGIAGLESLLAASSLDERLAETAWAKRKSLVFKPLNGYGSRGVYRGAKISRRRFDSLVGTGYMAQAYVEPVRRSVVINGVRIDFKGDIRVWTHGSVPWHAAARLYRGQVTGMRSRGEGFAPIVWMASHEGRLRCRVA